MAHFARLDENNVVVRVHVVHNDIATSEAAGIEFLQTLHKTNAVFKQCSYNTYGGVHYQPNSAKVPSEDQSKAFRKNYAGPDFTYDESKDAFIMTKPFASWVLNETTCLWEAPTSKPETFGEGLLDGNGNPVPDVYEWNEGAGQWDLCTEPEAS